MTVLASRPGRFLAPLLIAAVLFGGCGAAAAPGSSQQALAGPATPAAPTTTTVAPRVTEAPSDGDAVTGGEPESTTTPAPDATATDTAPGAAPTAEPAATPTAAAPATPTAEPVEQDPFAMNLFRKGDFVAQYTFEWCVGASLQMALNLSTDTEHTTRADQENLWEMARDRSFSPFGGANPIGWTAVLNELGIGPYELVSVPTLDEALAVAAEAIRATERPVGLVMWRGRHAWVMSGFKSTADPRRTDDFDVTGIRVLDPLYPHGSSVWGPSPKPNSLVSPATLAEQFVVRDGSRSRVNLGVPSGYLMIVPLEAA